MKECTHISKNNISFAQVAVEVFDEFSLIITNKFSTSRIVINPITRSININFIDTIRILNEQQPQTQTTFKWN